MPPPDLFVGKIVSHCSLKFKDSSVSHMLTHIDAIKLNDFSGACKPLSNADTRMYANNNATYPRILFNFKLK